MIPVLIFFIFLFKTINSLSLQSKLKSRTFLSQVYNPITLRTPTTGSRYHTGYSNTGSDNILAYQPGIPSAFIPMPLGARIGRNETANRYITPSNSNRTSAGGYYGAGYVPEQPGIPSAFVPQPLINTRNINNTASEAIPINYWVNVNNTDFVILKNRLGGYLSCSQNRYVTVNPQLLNGTSLADQLWIPQFIRYNTVALKSVNGGYLYLGDSLFYCNGTVSDLNSQYQVRVGLKNDRTRSIDFIAFKIGIGYLGIKDGNVLQIQQLDERSMFDPIYNSNSSINGNVSVGR